MKPILLALCTIMICPMLWAQKVNLNKDLNCEGAWRFTYVSDGLKEPEKVVLLDLSMRKLRTLEVDDLLKFPNLECLDISYNHFTDLPKDLVLLKNVRYLNIAGNNYLKRVPVELLRQMPGLRVLDVSDQMNWKKADLEALKKQLPGVRVLLE